MIAEDFLLQYSRQQIIDTYYRFFLAMPKDDDETKEEKKNISQNRMGKAYDEMKRSIEFPDYSIECNAWQWFLSKELSMIPEERKQEYAASMIETFYNLIRKSYKPIIEKTNGKKKDAIGFGDASDLIAEAGDKYEKMSHDIMQEKLSKLKEKVKPNKSINNNFSGNSVPDAKTGNARDDYESSKKVNIKSASEDKKTEKLEKAEKTSVKDEKKKNKKLILAEKMLEKGSRYGLSEEYKNKLKNIIREEKDALKPDLEAAEEKENSSKDIIPLQKDVKEESFERKENVPENEKNVTGREERETENKEKQGIPGKLATDNLIADETVIDDAEKQSENLKDESNKEYSKKKDLKNKDEGNVAAKADAASEKATDNQFHSLSDSNVKENKEIEEKQNRRVKKKKKERRKATVAKRRRKKG